MKFGSGSVDSPEQEGEGGVGGSALAWKRQDPCLPNFAEFPASCGA